MYKRRARILFLGQLKEPLELACGMVEQVASECLEARGLGVEALDGRSDELGWADLLIALDALACDWLPRAQTSMPYRCWSLPVEAAAKSEFLKQQLLSMVAGMRMLQRMDS
jgi:hypothetical protein